MPTTQGLTPLEAVNEIRNNNNGQVVLVLELIKAAFIRRCTKRASSPTG